MSSDPEFTGERFLPSLSGEIYYEHLHRYAFARSLVAGRRVLDAAAGEGYGSALLARSARSVVGLDIAHDVVASAAARYASRGDLRFVCASAARLPFAAGTFGAVVSFETIEHLPQALQAPMVAEFARVLDDQGLLIISSPNRALYSDARGYRNEFHLHELYRDELAALLAPHLPHQLWFRQRLQFWSGLWAEQPGKAGEEGERACSVLEDREGEIGPAGPPEAMYFVVIAARTARALPEQSRALWLFRDVAGTVESKAEGDARETLRLDALLRDRDTSMARQTEHVWHLEELVAFRERLVVERDATIARQADHVRHLEELVAHCEKIVVERDAQLRELNEAIAQARAALAASERQREALADKAPGATNPAATGPSPKGDGG